MAPSIYIIKGTRLFSRAFSLTFRVINICNYQVHTRVNFKRTFHCIGEMEMSVSGVQMETRGRGPSYLDMGTFLGSASTYLFVVRICGELMRT